jgi:hypothetical protein
MKMRRLALERARRELEELEGFSAASLNEQAAERCKKQVC